MHLSSVFSCVQGRGIISCGSCALFLTARARKLERSCALLQLEMAWRCTYFPCNSRTKRCEPTRRVLG